MPPLETYPEISRLPGIIHTFIRRVPGLPITGDKAAALAALEPHHRTARENLGLGLLPFVTAEQIHGNTVARVTGRETAPAPGADALVTDRPGVALGIYVADCGVVFAADPVARVIGLAHSGRKGTELGIVTAMLRAMAALGADPSCTSVHLAPCIRPPHYEIDFAQTILAQAREWGAAHVSDCGANTAADLSAYYSYRAERGRTGRMLAILAMA